MLTFNSIDVETANADRASICQIGIVHVRDGVVADTAWSASVHSPAQDRNELRNPCTVVRPARPALRRMCRTTLTQSPVRD